jgi:DNA-binding Xre family transcriptional regulator
MITFEPLRDIAKKRGKSIYALTKDKVIGGATLDKIRSNSPGVTVDTIDRICNYFSCKPSDIMRYTPGDRQPNE